MSKEKIAERYGGEYSERCEACEYVYKSQSTLDELFELFIDGRVDGSR